MSEKLLRRWTVLVAVMAVVILGTALWLVVRERRAFDDNCRAIGGTPVTIGRSWICLSPDQRILEGR